jgi:hypothetical protein
MSAILDTKRALERRLNTLGYPTAYESSNFTAPESLYLRTQFVINSPEDPVIGDKYYRERITFQVFVADRLNIGTANAFTVAEQIRSLFDKGLVLNEGSTSIYILGTPRVAGSVVTTERLVVPVSIEVLGEVFS